MNNWDVRPHISVVVGNPVIVEFFIQERFPTAAPRTIRIYEMDGNVIVNNIPDSTVDNAIELLEDHLESTIIPDWCNQDDSIDIPCYELWKGVYHAQGIDVHYYHIEACNNIYPE